MELFDKVLLLYLKEFSIQDVCLSIHFLRHESHGTVYYLNFPSLFQKLELGPKITTKFYILLRNILCMDIYSKKYEERCDVIFKAYYFFVVESCVMSK